MINGIIKQMFLIAGIEEEQGWNMIVNHALPQYESEQSKGCHNEDESWDDDEDFENSDLKCLDPRTISSKEMGRVCDWINGLNLAFKHELGGTKTDFIYNLLSLIRKKIYNYASQLNSLNLRIKNKESEYAELLENHKK